MITPFCWWIGHCLHTAGQRAQPKDRHVADVTYGGRMNNRSLSFLLVLLAGVLIVGCRPARQSVGSAGDTSFQAGCYRIEFTGVTESSEVASTWNFRVEGRSCAQRMRSWMLELPACASVVEASPTPWGVISQDPHYQMSGIQWQTGQDFESGEFSVVLTGDLEKGIARAGVEGQELSLGSLEGPVCKGAAAAGSPV